MSEFKRPASEEEFEKNFQQQKPLMNETEAYYESSRCLFCYDAPCVKACPTEIDIPLFIRQINSGDISGSASTIYASNYMGNTCGKVCPTEVLCEGSCVYNEQNIKPVEIGRLQNHATRQAIDEGKELFELAESNGKKVAVIGAGPSGVSCACELRSLGYTVDIFETKAKPSGLSVHGVAPYKITNEEALIEMDYLKKQFGYSVRYDSPIKSKEDIQNLASTYEAVFVGIGMGTTSALNIPGEELANCKGATEFIEVLKMNHLDVAIGKSVVVLGGGNTAMDAASESARMGAESVVLAYRRRADEMGAYEFEWKLAKGVGVQGEFNAAPIGIVGNGKVEGVRFRRTENKGGKLVEVEGSEFEIACDMVIKATGQRKQVDFLSLIDGLATDEKGRIEIDAFGRCGDTKFFAGGDAVNGGAEVVNAAAEGKMAAIGIHEYLSS
ncbi:MAG: FAD-dependent oxidoreductase [Cytophagales bacterium]|nr:FAD-dependent oxidoreductase [Cytophagales bacterium]